MKLRLPQLCWHGDTELELEFPGAWDVSLCAMRGHHNPKLTEDEFRYAFNHPIGSAPIREVAQGKKEVALLFDDMSRPTRVAQLLPYILDELELAGVPDDGIRLIAATGAHGAMNGVDFQKKLGMDVLERFPIYNHNPYENCVLLGKTSRGTPLSINSEVMSCDLKIGIGVIVPHPTTGFGGGSKIILPGVAAIDTIEAMHALAQSERTATGLGKFNGNPARLDVEEAMRMAGLDIKVDVLINGKGEMAGLFVGDPIAAHHEGVMKAMEVYATDRVSGANVVVANVYAKVNEAWLALAVGAQLMDDAGGDLVVIANSPEGQITHYLLRSFGKNVGGRLWRPRSRLPRKVKRLIIMAPYADRTAADVLGPPESIIWAKTWGQVIEEIGAGHNGNVRIAVLPDATIQYFRG